MKKAKSGFLVMVCLLFVVTTSQVFIHTYGMDSYDFPTKPGSKEWKLLRTHAEMLAACQVPEKILKKMSTVGLAKTVLDYPLFIDMLAANSSQQIWFDSLKKDFNGLGELMARNDSGRRLLGIYKKMNPIRVAKMKDITNGGSFTFKLQYLELIISQSEVVSNLSIKEKKNLLIYSKQVYQNKKKSDIFSDIDRQRTCLVMGKTMLSAKYKPFVDYFNTNEEVRYLLETGNASNNKEFPDEILRLTDQFISDDK